jgi:hypothetical protein
VLLVLVLVRVLVLVLVLLLTLPTDQVPPAARSSEQRAD